MTRTMILELDELDFETIQKEITDRQRDDHANGSETMLPEGESNLAGAILAECVRDLKDYRDLMASAG